MDPTKLASLTTSFSAGKCPGFRVDIPPFADGDGKFTTMFPREEIKKDLCLESVASATSDDTTESTFHQTPTTASTMSPDMLETSDTALVSRQVAHDNFRPPSLTCDMLPCRGRKFESLGSFQSHKDEAHRFCCEYGCSDVGYPSVRDLKARHYGPFHKQYAGQYKCGRCGETGYRQDNHTRHLSRKRPCRASASPQKYACGRCGETTYKKDEHLTHLRRRGCEAS